MIFGRAGEEIAELEAQGIAVSVVPGITAGWVMASALGVSLTHREDAHSVRFVTGHARNGEMPDDLDWQGLADSQTTLVFYMAGKTGPSIARHLVEHGLSPEVPVVMAAGIGRRDAWQWAGTLGDLRSQAPTTTGLPVLLAIGRALKTAAASGAAGGSSSLPLGYASLFTRVSSTRLSAFRT